MSRCRVSACLTVAVIGFVGFSSTLTGQSQEFRALWVDTFHPALRNATEVSNLVADARTGNFNAVVVEVRKRGDAYYNSNYEPKATDVSPQSYDPLADLIARAHNTNTGARIEVHAWIVTYPIWNNTNISAAPANHPVRLHPDWLSETTNGVKFSGNYVFDPAHPGVQEHTFNVAMDIITRYDVDGLNFDYIRYFDTTWGYNPVAVARFNDRYGRTGKPATSDETWKQFRREQVTALLRKVYLATVAVKPHVKISTDTIGGTPGVTSDSDFVARSQAYKDRLQDWRGWMEEGILDINILMAYFNQTGQYAPDWTNWNAYLKDRRYNRHSVVGPGIYLNTMSNGLFQMRYTRRPSPAGNYADGVCVYSYATPASDGTTTATFLAAVTRTNTSWLYETNLVPMFATPATPPVMPWKVAPTKGHLKGFVYGGTVTNPLDGASVALTGLTNKTMRTDATGFYGAVDLLPGSYTVTASMSGGGSVSSNFTIAAGAVTTVNLLVVTNDTTPPVIFNVAVAGVSDTTALLTWSTDEPADSVLNYGTTTNYGHSLTNTELVLNHALLATGLLSSTTYHGRVRSRDSAGNQAVSGDFVFTTNPSGMVNDLIIDNPEATTVGSWIVTTPSTDKYGADYAYKGVGTGASYLEYRPTILKAGTYQVFAWHPQGTNRTTNAPHLITYAGGTTTIGVNQETNGGQWNLLAVLPFAAGTNSYVRITDAFPEPSGNVVLADAIKFVFVPPLVPPSITAHPQSQSVKAGSNATFTVTASGTAPLSYQWRQNGTNIPGATSSNYARFNVVLADAGLYSVRVSNSVGAVTSSNATLTVLLPVPPELETPELLPDTRVRLLMSGEPGYTYRIQSSLNLSNWSTLGSVFNTNGAFEFIDSPATNQPRRFYRLEVP
jgi:uncharacterized lipoprotein YddW (UPF0748 family)